MSLLEDNKMEDLLCELSTELGIFRSGEYCPKCVIGVLVHMESEDYSEYDGTCSYLVDKHVVLCASDHGYIWRRKAINAIANVNGNVDTYEYWCKKLYLPICHQELLSIIINTADYDNITRCVERGLKYGTMSANYNTSDIKVAEIFASAGLDMTYMYVMATVRRLKQLPGKLAMYVWFVSNGYKLGEKEFNLIISAKKEHVFITYIDRFINMILSGHVILGDFLIKDRYLFATEFGSHIKPFYMVKASKILNEALDGLLYKPLIDIIVSWF